ncbi:uncharacterized protein LOC135685070 [Rhopilema esculentum]|uniref:uncharacterized protein LOC135685070 n=1 Tax=Rhopilema esculentum TaxID=499914 RepID=UPI0031DDB249
MCHYISNMAHASVRNLGRIVCSASQAKMTGLLRQAVRRNNLSGLKSVFAEISTSNKHCKSSLQNILKSAGVKSKQRFNMNEMQRCLAVVAMISNVSVSNVTSGSDCDMLEGSEEGDEVCSQGKKHSRRSICT